MMWAVCRNCEDDVVMRVTLQNKDQQIHEQTMRMPKLQEHQEPLRNLKCPTNNLQNARFVQADWRIWDVIFAWNQRGKAEFLGSWRHALRCRMFSVLAERQMRQTQTDVSFASGFIARKIPNMREASPLQSSQLLHKLANVWCTQSWALRLMCAQSSQHWKAIRLQSVLPNMLRSWD